MYGLHYYPALFMWGVLGKSGSQFLCDFILYPKYTHTDTHSQKKKKKNVNAVHVFLIHSAAREIYEFVFGVTLANSPALDQNREEQNNTDQEKEQYGMAEITTQPDRKGEIKRIREGKKSNRAKQNMKREMSEPGMPWAILQNQY